MSTQTKPRLLMCPPTAYSLDYVINAWMSLENQPDVDLAATQWAELYRTLTEVVGAEVELIEQASNAPDMVFTANAGLIDRRPGTNRILLSRFRHAERQVEVPFFRNWFEAHGYECLEPAEKQFYEGEGDALFVGDILVAGYLKRSDIASHTWMAEQLGVQTLSLELTDGRWYHLDTAFFSPMPGRVVYYPGAFDSYAVQVIEQNFETIVVEENEALRFACNSVVLGKSIVMPSGCPILTSKLEAWGFTIYPVELSEFLKAGGAAKCLTLHLP
ncbi:MAG: arginine deiminase-related protein [Chthonomonadales bacterium]